MPRLCENISGITGVAAGGDAIIPMTSGQRYFSATLFPGATIGGVVTAAPTQAQLAAAIDLITLQVGGSTVREMTVNELCDENAQNGIAFQNGVLPIEFAESKRATSAGEEALSWPIPEGVPFQIKVRWNAAVVAPVLAASAEFDTGKNVNSKGQEVLNIVHWVRQTVQVTGAGNKDENTFPVDGVLQRITLRTANVLDVLAKVGTRTVYEQAVKGNTNRLARHGLSVQANTFPIVFDSSQVVDDGIDTGGRPLKLKLNMSGAGDFQALIQIRRATFKA